MIYQQPTLGILTYLKNHPEIRAQIRAAHGQTLLYAGFFFKPVWKEIADFKARHPELSRKELLPDVLARIAVPGTPYASLLAYVQEVERQVPWKPDGFTVWRALSGIFASNASGAVSFQIGSGITPADKVFAATELSVLARNGAVDANTRELLAYFQQCIRSRQSAINVGFIAG